MRGLFRYYRVAQLSLQLVVFLLAGLVCWNAYHVYFADSEIWSINLGYYFLEDLNDFWVFTRFVFYAPLFAFTAPFQHAENIFYSARTLMVLNILLQIFLLQKFTYQSTRSRFLSWLAPALFLVCSFSITQFFRIRSDLFLGTWILAVVYFINSSSFKVEGFLKRIPIYSLSILVTPKAIFYLPIFFILDKRTTRQQLIFGFLLLPLAFLLIYFSTMLRLGLVSDAALNFLDYFKSSFSSDEGVGYFSLEAFMYVSRFVNENILLSFLWLGSAVVTMRRQGKVPSHIKRARILALYIAFMWIFFPDRLPFFLSSLIPLIVYCGVVFIQQVYWNGETARRIRGLWLFSAFLLIHFFVSSVIFLQKVEYEGVTSNREQINTIKNFREYLEKYPGLTYYDVIGIVPERNTIRKFAGPHQKKINDLNGQKIQEIEPDIILKSKRFGYYEPQISEFLNEKYINMGFGVYFKAFLLNPDKSEFKMLKAATKNKDLIKYSQDFSRFPEEEPIFSIEDLQKRANTRYTPLVLEKGEKIKKVSGVPKLNKSPNRNALYLFKFDDQF